MQIAPQNISTLFEIKIKKKILKEFNEDLYRNFNMTITDADELYGWGCGYIYKILNRVFKKYGPIGLKKETVYIIQYFDFLFKKLNYVLSLEEKQLPHSNRDIDLELYKLLFSLTYYLQYYRHYGRRKIENPNQLCFRLNN